MMHTSFNWKIGGEAGYGILSVGAMFSRAMVRAGQFTFDYDEYPSLIRGGHNTYEVGVSPDPVLTVRRPIHVLVALNQQTVDAHKEELAPDAVILYNSNNSKVGEGDFLATQTVVGIPLEDLAIKAGADRVGRNTVSLGASLAVLGAPFELAKEVIELNFSLKKKDDKVSIVNVAAAKTGYDFIKQQMKGEQKFSVQVRQNPKRMIISGNDALAWGAIKAGCNFFSGYPMTPATSILQLFAKQAPKYNLVVKHTEDEISAIGAAIGAGYAGVRSMTATSGGGFSLMVESLGMAGMIEVPVVIVNSMRPGPSTGMPTWTSQDDLKFVLSASQGDFPRVVMAPGDQEQCYRYIQSAFNIAEKYQTPVIVLMDKYISASHKSIDRKDLLDIKVERGKVVGEKELSGEEKYLRYADAADGVSPRSLPGTKGGVHVANSDEHNEYGFAEEGAANRARMMDKRYKKMAVLAKELPAPELEGESHAELTLITWGSTRGTVKEAVAMLKEQGHKINFMQIVYLSPFPVEKIRDVFKHAKKVAIVENNKVGQLAGWLRDQTGLSPDYKILKYDGRPFFANELVETIKELL